MSATSLTSAAPGPRPNPGVVRPYSNPAPTAPIDLWLAGNEGRPLEALPLRLEGENLRRYPSTAAVAARAAGRFGVRPEQVLVTAGADDALLRCSLAYLAAGRSAVLPSPTFEMIPRYAELAGGEVREVPWAPGTPYPVDEVLSSIDASTSLVYVVSPNNPTGAVAAREDVEALCQAAPEALVVVDQAYGEFAEDDLTACALRAPNAICLRTMSKAYGAAGLRVGFALGQPDVLGILQAAGNPYPCAAPSLLAAERLLEADLGASVETVSRERDLIAARLRGRGLNVAPGQGNFVYAPTGDSAAIRARIAEAGIAIRDLGGALRITCPQGGPELERLLAAIDSLPLEVKP